jgi:hypothetical protein
MNISGIWPLNNFMAQIATNLPAVANLLLALPVKKAARPLLRSRLLLPAKNKI